MRSEGSQVSQAVKLLGPARGGISYRRLKGEVVVIDATEESDSHELIPFLQSRFDSDTESQKTERDVMLFVNTVTQCFNYDDYPSTGFDVGFVQIAPNW